MRNQIDEIDIVSLFVLPLAAGIEFGVWTLSLDVFGGFDFGQTLTSFSGVDITLSFVIAMLAMIALVATGSLSKGDYQKEEWYVIGGSLAVLPFYVCLSYISDAAEEPSRVDSAGRRTP
jgi:hypothetical protein